MQKTILKCQRCKELFAHWKRTKGGIKKMYCVRCVGIVNREKLKLKALVAEKAKKKG